MLNAKQIALAFIVCGSQEMFVAGYLSDIQQLSDAGFAERVWVIKLDNGHRPYPVLKKRVNFEAADVELPAKPLSVNNLTSLVNQLTGLTMRNNLFTVEQTYLFRKNHAFWSELWVDFSGDGGSLEYIRSNEYYAVYQGRVMPAVCNIKFVRLDIPAHGLTITTNE